ncbi:19847_t:CDS:2, partial [Gigaspora margarita]
PQDVFLDPILSVIEWNDAALQQRRVMKANITNFIQRVNGVQPFTDTDAVTNVGAQYDSIFSIIDIRIAPKSQIAADIMAYLRRTYGQQPNVSLGKFYIIQTAKKNQFEIAEYREVF